MCLYPKLIKNPKYKPNNKNGGQVPPILDNRVLTIPVGCGRCMECKKQKSREWQVRLMEDIRHNKNGKFVTLTFDESSYNKFKKKHKNLKGYELENRIATDAVRKFTERWRKKHKKTIRHWLITELGQNNTERIHIHGIVWTDEIEDISEKWGYGITTIGYRKYYKGKKMNNLSLGWVNEQTINYVVKYVNKTDILHKEYKSVILTSNGIGKNYIERADAKNNKYVENNTQECYVTRQGIKLNMPNYYKNKIYTDEEKEKLWIEKLDKEIRYVDKKKIDISKGFEEYYKALAEARGKNERLGYGKKEKWDSKIYDEQQRELRVKKHKSIVANPTAEPQPSEFLPLINYHNLSEIF